MQYSNRYSTYVDYTEQTLQEIMHSEHPALLYDPIRYTLQSGGKRVRPALTMMCCEAVGGIATDARFGAVAVEIIHNFTLVHDDIMDAAPMRRNKPTVHTQWNNSAAILAGDAMIALAYDAVLRTPRLQRVTEIIHALNTGILEVCEGQALDLEFQERHDVSLTDYVQMIEKKTARMLEMAAIVGGYIGMGTPEQVSALQQFANALGLAFQIQDDLLDATAEQDVLGKTVGGDIVEGKRTYLVLQALSRTLPEEDIALMHTFMHNRGLPHKSVPLMQSLFERNGIVDDAKAEVERQTQRAHTALDLLPQTDARNMLHFFADMLLERQH